MGKSSKAKEELRMGKTSLLWYQLDAGNASRFLGLVAQRLWGSTTPATARIEPTPFARGWKAVLFRVAGRPDRVVRVGFHRESVNGHTNATNEWSCHDQVAAKGGAPQVYAKATLSMGEYPFLAPWLGAKKKQQWFIIAAELERMDGDLMSLRKSPRDRYAWSVQKDHLFGLLRELRILHSDLHEGNILYQRVPVTAANPHGIRFLVTDFGFALQYRQDGRVDPAYHHRMRGFAPLSKWNPQYDEEYLRSTRMGTSVRKLTRLYLRLVGFK